MIRSYKGKTPRIAEDAFVSEAAYVVGDVEIGAGSSVWPGAVVRADFAPIRIGSNTHIEDNSTLHQGDPIDVGDNVTIGHNVVVHCRRIGHDTLIANHATLLDRAEVGAGCVVAAGAVLRPDTKVPDGSFVAGGAGNGAALERVTADAGARLRQHLPGTGRQLPCRGTGRPPPLAAGLRSGDGPLRIRPCRTTHAKGMTAPRPSLEAGACPSTIPSRKRSAPLMKRRVPPRPPPPGLGARTGRRTQDQRFREGTSAAPLPNHGGAGGDGGKRRTAGVRHHSGRHRSPGSDRR